MRKWLDAFGAKSDWDVTAEQLDTAAQAMLQHGCKPSAVNRDLSALGSVYRWAKATRSTLPRIRPLRSSSQTTTIRRWPPTSR